MTCADRRLLGWDTRRSCNFGDGGAILEVMARFAAFISNSSWQPTFVAVPDQPPYGRSARAQNNADGVAFRTIVVHWGEVAFRRDDFEDSRQRGLAYVMLARPERSGVGAH